MRSQVIRGRHFLPLSNAHKSGNLPPFSTQNPPLTVMYGRGLRRM